MCRLRLLEACCNRSLTKSVLAGLRGGKEGFLGSLHGARVGADEMPPEER
jgi:hypothetical protein